jgi:hypothetical protein
MHIKLTNEQEKEVETLQAELELIGVRVSASALVQAAWKRWKKPVPSVLTHSQIRKLK